MTKARAAKEPPPIVEELHFRSDNAFLCMLLNRRTKQIRVIDFRAGALPAKRLFIQSVALREGVKKVMLLVEKDEVSSWTRVGFVREGTVPGFYKRSDGHLVGCVIGDRTASIEVSDAVQRQTDKTITAAKKRLEEFADTPKSITVKQATERQAQSARDTLWKKPSAAYGSFDNFGRDAARIYYEAASKKAKPNFISAEFQDCFGHSLVEVLRVPANDAELAATIAGLRTLGEDLKKREIVSAFAFAPFDNEVLSTAFLAAGYRKTGLLAQGVVTEGERSDAILWSRKLADPGGGDSSSEDYD
ncbi:MAG: hypothetical protein OEZ06_08885 [Myxococcales bacterium]|nr:hypothetical protein [Myxococcales bacterium]